MKLLRTLTLAALAFAPLTAMAADGTKFVVVNVQQVMRDSAAAKAMRDQLEAKQKSFQADISKQEAALQKEEQELSKQQSALAKEAFEEKVKAFRTKATAMQKDVAGKKAMLDNAYETSVNQIQKTVTDIIASMAKDKGFQAAIPSSQLLYAETGMDITADVLKALNEKMPSFSVKFDAPKAPEKK